MKNNALLADLKKSGYFYYSSLDFILCALNACMAFLVPFLSGRGLPNTSIGILLAANSAASVLFPPFFGVLADKLKSKRRTFMISLFLTVLSLLGVLVSRGFWLLLATTTIFAGARSANISLGDTWILSETSRASLDGSRINFGAVRMWGSVGFSLFCLLYYFAITKGGADVSVTFMISAGGAVLSFLAARLGKNRESGAGASLKPVTFRELRLGRLFKNYYFVTFLLVYVLMSSTMFFGQSYITNLMEDIGIDPAATGLFNSIRAFAEVPLLFALPFIVRRVGYKKALMATSVLYVAEQFWHIYATSFASLVGAQVLRGLASGVMFGTAVSYIFTLVPRSLSATAQTVASASAGLLGIVGNFFSGYIIDAFGIRSLFWLNGLLQAAGLVLFAAALLVGKVKKIPLHTEEEEAI